MELSAVITGDIISSSKLNAVSRQQLLAELKNTIAGIESIFFNNGEKLLFQIFRGDSFQLLIPNASIVFLIALFIKSSLRSHFHNEEEDIWDIRQSIGIGTISFNAGSISEMDGDAFRRSGPYLDSMKHGYSLGIQTPWQDLNEIFNFTCRFIEYVTDRWTSNQAQVVSYSIFGHNQQNIANQLNISQSAVNQRLKSAGWHVLTDFEKYFKKQIELKLK